MQMRRMLKDAKSLRELANEQERIKTEKIAEEQWNAVEKAIDKMYEHRRLQILVPGIRYDELLPEVRNGLLRAGYKTVHMDSDGKLNDKGEYLGLTAE